MTHEELLVEMFGQTDTVAVEFYDRADKEHIHNIIKENIIHKAKGQNYLPISEPVVSVYEYLKKIGHRFIPVPDKTEADLIVFRTIVKVVKKALNG